MTANAFLLSVIYLAVGLLVEVGRRLYPSRLLLRLSLALDSLPARALEVTGLMEPLSQAYLSGRVSDAWGRAIFSVTTLVIIFVLALLVGLLMGGLRLWLERRAWRKLRGP
ncbi:hypothetical protein P2318_08700 [Myxococcaceae bacterium GXIMD 01537]